MATVKHQLFRAPLLLMVCLSISLPSNGKEEDKSLEHAKAALEEAQSALQAAQNSLNTAEEINPLSKPKQQITQPKRTVQPEPRAQVGKLYKWVDEDGKISYQDTPPPNEANVLDSDVLKDLKDTKAPIRELRRASEESPLLDGSQPVMVYTADNCKPCQSVILFLTQKEVPFIERDIRDDRRARERLAKLSKQISVPSLFIGTRIVQGHSKPEITAALKQAGYLQNVQSRR